MADYLPIRAFNRSQNVRIDNQKILPGTTYFVDISKGSVKKELASHAAIGAIFTVGPLSAGNQSTNGVVSAERTFTETTGAGTYTASVALPAGSTLLDVVVNGVALWTAASAATLIVGDGTDPDGYYTAVNLKATDLLVDESISFALAGGKAGAYIANSQVSPRYAAAARSIIGVVTTTGSTGNAGRTRMIVTYYTPISTSIVAATKA